MSSSGTDQGRGGNSRPNAAMPGLGVPLAAPAVPDAAKLVGKWRATVVEFGHQVQIDWEARINGSTRYHMTSDRGVTEGTGTWQLSGGILTEQYSRGGWGKASIVWRSDNQFELTITAHSHPEAVGLKRVYTRL